MKKPEITVEVVTDVVCPWCYIGKRRLEKAVDLLKDQYDVKLTFSPFELNADMPAEGVDQRAYLAKKFGGEEKYDQITGHVSKIAKDEGLSFNFNLQRISPNTRDAHRIIRYAHEESKQAPVNEAFMKAYFEDGVDLSRKENLIAVAVKGGLEKHNVEALLNSDKELAEVIFSEEMNHQRGISGVPFFIVNNKYGVSGAQPTDTFVKVLSEIGQQVTLSDDTCEVESKDC